MAQTSVATGIVLLLAYIWLKPLPRSSSCGSNWDHNGTHLVAGKYLSHSVFPALRPGFAFFKDTLQVGGSMRHARLLTDICSSPLPHPHMALPYKLRKVAQISVATGHGLLLSQFVQGLFLCPRQWDHGARPAFKILYHDAPPSSS